MGAGFGFLLSHGFGETSLCRADNVSVLPQTTQQWHTGSSHTRAVEASSGRQVYEFHVD